MRTTDFCFPLLRLRVPVPPVLPASLRGLRLALGRRACTRDPETGGPGVSRRPIRFGGLPRVDARFVSPAFPIEPYLWHPCRSRISGSVLSHAAIDSGRQGRFARPSV